MKKLIMLLSAALMTLSFGFAMADDAAKPATDSTATATPKAKKHHGGKKHKKAKKDDAATPATK